MSVVIAPSSEAAAGSDAYCQARVVAKDATGSDIPNEGKLVQAADVSSITCVGYQLDSTTPGTALTPSITITSAAFTALTSDSTWGNIDAVGRNFFFAIAGGTYLLTAGIYRFVFTAVLNSGTRIVWAHDHVAAPVIPT